MKKFVKIISLVLAIVSLMAVAAPALAATGYVDTSYGSVPGGTVNYYSNYTESVSVSGLTQKGTLSNGTSINVTSVNTHWYKFTKNSTTYYVLKQFVYTSGNGWQIQFGTMELNLGCSWTRYVKQMQIALNLLGYNTNGIDGAFGPNTRTALINFQRNKGLAQDGRCGPATKQALYNALYK